MSGFKITYAPQVVESLKTKTKRDITASESDSTITSANVLEGLIIAQLNPALRQKKSWLLQTLILLHVNAV
jgi:hypothetical protein